MKSSVYLKILKYSGICTNLLRLDVARYFSDLQIIMVIIVAWEY